MRHAVLFSSYIPQHSLELGKKYVELLKTFFSRDTVFVGVNRDSCGAWEDLLKQENFHYRKVEEKFHIDSDVSGFMECLKMVRDSHERFDLFWLFHTKGASYDDLAKAMKFYDYYRQNFFARRKDIEEIMTTYPNIGLAANYLIMNAAMKTNDNSMRMKIFYPFKYKPVGYFVFGTFYAMRGTVVHEFLDNCEESFFTKNLVTELGFDRYFFEVNFCVISNMMGYDAAALDYKEGPQHEFLMRKCAEWRKDPVNYEPENFPWW